MAEDPGNDGGQIGEQEGASHYLDLFEKSPSEHAKTVIVQEKLVPWIKNKGMNRHAERRETLSCNLSISTDIGCILGHLADLL
jgi:hypothetical protein